MGFQFASNMHLTLQLDLQEPSPMSTRKAVVSPKFASQKRVLLPGSERLPFNQHPRKLLATGSKPVARGGLITVSVVLQPRQPLDPQSMTDPAARMTRATLAAEHGPDPAAVRLLRAFASEYGLTLEGAAPAGSRMLRLSGSKAALQKAFSVTLTDVDADGDSYRVREGGIHLPEELAPHVVAVLGLDNRPQAAAHFRIRKPQAQGTSYTPVQVAQLYGFPAGATAPSQTIGLIELGGGFRKADLTTYFQGLGLPVPTVTAVLVDGGKNAPTTASGADGEVMLDIEVAAAVAPGAKIVVYFAPNTDQGFIDAISTAVHDTTNKPSVVSISLGGPESSWTAQATTALDQAAQAAAAVGVTITVACGDSGSTDGVSDGANHVDFPASSPHVLACGGTRLDGTGSTIASEVVWNELALNEGATGGGVSTIFALPTWQANAGVPAAGTSSGGRGVPDVAGNADPATGYQVRVDGQDMVIGGTSAVAPLWAGLIALANQAKGTTAGFVNPALYAAPASFHDITQGSNGAFNAGPGWDACTGLGSPVGNAVISSAALPAATTASKRKSSSGGAG